MGGKCQLMMTDKSKLFVITPWNIPSSFAGKLTFFGYIVMNTLWGEDRLPHTIQYSCISNTVAITGRHIVHIG